MAKKKTAKKKAVKKATSVKKTMDSDKTLIIAGILAIILTWVSAFTTPIQEILLTLVGLLAISVGPKKKGALKTATLIAGIVTVILAWIGFLGSNIVLTLAGLTMIVVATRK